MNNKIVNGVKCFLYVFGLLGVALNAQGASFDCGKAQSKVEHLICDNPKLSTLDDKLGKVYQDVTGKANEEEKQRVITEQKHWLKHTRNICENESCIKIAYWSRQAELETFFEPKSLLYEHESDKAEVVKQVIATSPLYPSQPDSQFCAQIFEDLKRMENVHFVDPIVQTQSYEDPALDPWKEQGKQASPFNKSVTCEWKMLEADPDGTGGLCPMAFGLPPFKLFELPPLQPSEDKRYILYYDGSYGPMNMEIYKPAIGDFGVFRQINVANDNAAVADASGGRPSYNSIVEYQQKYYFLTLVTSLGSYKLNVESVNPYRSKNKQICNWTPVAESIKSKVIKPRKAFKPLPLDQGGQ